MLSLEVLNRTRELMADPDQVVRDPIHLYEDAGCRGCFIGNYYRAAEWCDEVRDTFGFARTLWPDALEPSAGPMATNALRQGREHCVELLDAAITRANVTDRMLVAA